MVIEKIVDLVLSLLSPLDPSGDLLDGLFDAFSYLAAVNSFINVPLLCTVIAFCVSTALILSISKFLIKIIRG